MTDLFTKPTTRAAIPPPTVSPDRADVEGVVDGEIIDAVWGTAVAADLAELWEDKADETALEAHIAGPLPAHAANLITAAPNVTPMTGLDVQTQLTQAAGGLNALDASLGTVSDAVEALDSEVEALTFRQINTQVPLTGGGDLTADRTIGISDFAGTTSGAVPGSAGGTVNFLRADGTWATPPGQSNLTDGDKGDITVSMSGAQWAINPGAVTKAEVGLGNVDNTSDLNKPVSDATQAELDMKARAWTLIETQLPLTGGGDLTDDRMIRVNTFGAAQSGVVPQSGGGTDNFLRADGTWAPPAGGGGGGGFVVGEVIDSDDWNLYRSSGSYQTFFTMNPTAQHAPPTAEFSRGVLQVFQSDQDVVQTWGVQTATEQEFWYRIGGHPSQPDLWFGWTKIYPAAGGGGGGGVEVTVYTPGSYTWTKPVGVKRVTMDVLGGGGGGGSGRLGATSTVRQGGGGGGGAARSAAEFDADDLPASFGVTVGVGGNGAPGPITNDTNGANGISGLASFVMEGSVVYVMATGGGGGGAGSTSFGTAGTAGTGGRYPGTAGGAGGSAAATITNQDGGGGGGGGGSQLDATNTATSALSGRGVNWAGVSVAAGGVPNGVNNGSPGTPPGTATPRSMTPGCGGGGGAPTLAGVGGSGGAGGPGAGGGGGSGALNGQSVGAGGKGGDGLAVITAYF